MISRNGFAVELREGEDGESLIRRFMRKLREGNSPSEEAAARQEGFLTRSQRRKRKDAVARHRLARERRKERYHGEWL